jgi:hypothetical protein
MDRDYAWELAQYCMERDIPKDMEIKQQEFPDFPIERARLRSVFVLNAVFVLSTVFYGQAVEWHIAIPLALQFLGEQIDLRVYMKSVLTISAVAFTATAIFNINSTLMIDLYPSKPASATAIVSNELTLATLIETNGLE